MSSPSFKLLVVFVVGWVRRRFRPGARRSYHNASQNAAQELFRTGMRGRPKDLATNTMFDNLPVLHEDQRVGDLSGKTELVGDDEHRHPVIGQSAHNIEHLAHAFRVECAGWLIKQHDLRVHNQCPGDTDALLFPARKAARVGM